MCVGFIRYKLINTGGYLWISRRRVFVFPGGNKMAAVIESTQDIKSRLHQYIQNRSASSDLASWLGKIVYSGNKGSLHNFYFTQNGLHRLFPSNLRDELTDIVRELSGDYTAVVGI